ncbi:MAG: LysE family transporter [bacterium]|nr:LysE family transporter [bacterium]
MTLTSIILFYVSCYWISFMLCIPLGPVNLEVFHTALKKHYPQAIAVAGGGATGDAVWAAVAFFGVSPFMNSPQLEGLFLVATTIITLFLGIFALKDSKFVEKKEEELVAPIRRRKRWAFLKGLTMVLVNPLGVISWMICLQFLRKVGWYIEMRLNYEILFYIVVMLGAISYFSLIIFITNKMKHIFNPKRTRKITKCLGFLLLGLSAYFLYNAVKVIFFNSHVLSNLPK